VSDESSDEVEFPWTAWRYHLDVPVEPSDRQNLVDSLEAEELGLFEEVPREEVARRILEGRLRWSADRGEPIPSFPQDLSVISLFLFQIVKGLEVAERYVAEDVTDDVRAWKVVARRGEWVKVPLVVRRDDEARFVVDDDADDLDVLRARWREYPLWFQDGMRRKHPSLRAL
jgi:hypothetical protein